MYFGTCINIYTARQKNLVWMFCTGNHVRKCICRLRSDEDMFKKGTKTSYKHFFKAVGKSRGVQVEHGTHRTPKLLGHVYFQPTAPSKAPSKGKVSNSDIMKS
jgi:hypothetical protein